MNASKTSRAQPAHDEVVQALVAWLLREVAPLIANDRKWKEEINGNGGHDVTMSVQAFERITKRSQR